MRNPKLYKTPIIVAWIFFGVGLLSVLNMTWIPLLVKDFDGMDGGFALILLGILLVITAFVIFYYFGRLNREFTKMLSGQSLLSFVMPDDHYRLFCNKQADDIKTGNKGILFTIYAFSILFGVIFTLLIDPLFIAISVGIAVFFTIVYFVTTGYRTKKVKRSEALICLNDGGVYLFGNMHSWSVPGARLLSVEFSDGNNEHLPCPVLSLTYMAIAYPVPRHETVSIPIPKPFIGQAERAVAFLKNKYSL